MTVYGELKDRDENVARVQDSGEAGRETVRIVTANSKGDDAPPLFFDTHTAARPCLTREQARELAEILLHFAGEEDEWSSVRRTMWDGAR